MSCQNKDIAGIDVIKFLMAFAVIAIHCRLSELHGETEWPKAIGFIVSLAVPFFFIASGFLLSRRIDSGNLTDLEKQRFIRKRSLVLFRIFICWLIVYLPIAIYSYSTEGTPLFKAITGYLYKAILSGHSMWAWQLWFVYSMAWVFLLFSFVKLSDRNLIILGLLFIITTILNIGFQKYVISSFKWLYILTHKTLGGGGFIS